MKNKTKILVALCMVSILALTLCVSAFADDVAEGEGLRVTIIGAEVGETYADELSITPNTNISVKATLNNSVEYDNIAYKVDIYESSLGIQVSIYDSAESYSDMLPTFSYSSYDLGTLVLDFTGLSAYTYLETEGVYVELVTVANDYVTTGFFGVITEIMGFITGSMASVQSVFFANGNLTMLGALSVLAVGISLVLLIIAFVRKFLQLRG